MTNQDAKTAIAGRPPKPPGADDDRTLIAPTPPSRPPHQGAHQVQASPPPGQGPAPGGAPTQVAQGPNQGLGQGLGQAPTQASPPPGFGGLPTQVSAPPGGGAGPGAAATQVSPPGQAASPQPPPQQAAPNQSAPTQVVMPGAGPDRELRPVEAAPGQMPGPRPPAAPRPGVTRMVGFPAPSAPSTPARHAMDAVPTPPQSPAPASAGQQMEGPAVGWLVVVEGPGRGRSREIGYGMNTIGRDASQRIPLDFGDDGISREKAAAIAYVPNQRKFYLTPGEGINIVFRNDDPVLAPVELGGGDVVKIGATSLRFVPLCGPDFAWEDLRP